jgi:hypothetical protein
MANHEDACSASKGLCEQLFASLNQRIPNLEYEQQGNKCKFKTRGARRALAWVNSHSSRHERLNIWFAGSMKEAQKFEKLDAHPRVRPENAGGWAPFEGSFNINNSDELTSAVELLVKIAYPASLQ